MKQSKFVELKQISNFTQIQVYKHGSYWYITDCTNEGIDPFYCVIGGFHPTYKDAVLYAENHYQGIYH